MTRTGEIPWFRSRGFLSTAGLLLVVLVSLGLWYGPGIIEGGKRGEAIRNRLPSLPDTSGWPSAFSQALEAASEEASERWSDGSGLSELALLYHANAFLKEADACYALLTELDPEEPRWAYYLADVRLNWGDLSSAENLLKEVVALNPSYLPAQIRLGDVLFKSGKSEAADALYQRSLQLDPGNAYALLGLARERLKRGADEEALSLLNRLVDGNPEFGPGHMLKAQLLEKLGDSRGGGIARALGEKHGRYREPPDPWMDTVTTRCYDLDRLAVIADMNVATREFERALNLLDQAEGISPDFARIHLIRGLAYSSMGDKAAAVRAYKRALQLGGDSTTIYGELANLEKKSGNKDRAISMSRKGLEDDPDSPELLSILAELLIEQGMRAEARAHLRRALRGDPAHLPSLRNLARTLWEEGREEEAMDLFQNMRRLSPLDFHSRAFLAQHYLENGDPERAEEPLREALELEPDSAELRELHLTFLLQSGNRKARAGDFLGASADYQEALAADPGNVGLHLNLGYVYAQMDEFEAAIKHFQEARAADPGNVGLHLNLGYVYAQMDEFEAATRHLRKYTEERPEDFNGWVALGDMAWEDLRHSEAREFWRKAIIVAGTMRNSGQIKAALEERLRREIPK